MQDFAAKILCDNLQSLLTNAALDTAQLAPTRRINRAAVHSILKPLMPSLMLSAEVEQLLLDALSLIAKRTYSHRPGVMKTKPRKSGPKPHKSMANKPC